MTTVDLFRSAISAFLNADIENPQRNAEILLSHLLRCSTGEIYLKKKIEIDRENFKSFVKKRIAGEPWAYIFNSVQFRDLELRIKKGVFIPRPETEILVEEVIKTVFLTTQPTPLSTPNNFTLLDIGTGSGNIAISLAKNFPSVSILATDISKTALKIAKLNTLRYNLKNICFLCSDLFKNIPQQKFDIIVSNPPYIPNPDLKMLPEEVQKEPQAALGGGKKGISVLAKIIKDAPCFLKKGGSLFLEIGIGQNNLLKKIITQSKLKLIKTVKDYQKIPRVAIIKKG